LKGDKNSNKFYIPDVYIERSNITDSFQSWLKSKDFPCFAVVGDSGLGKTNFMCATAEMVSQRNFVLFYSAIRLLNGGLTETISNDFIWEFSRDQHISYIVKRFDDIANRHGRKLIIFLDGVDEVTNKLSLKTELINLVDKLRGSHIRVCISCKAFD